MHPLLGRNSCCTLSALVCTACLHSFPSTTHLSESTQTHPGALLLLREVALTAHAVTFTAQSPALGHISALFYIYTLPISLGAPWERSFHFWFVCKVLGTSLVLAANKKSKDIHLQSTLRIKWVTNSSCFAHQWNTEPPKMEYSNSAQPFRTGN